MSSDPLLCFAIRILKLSDPTLTLCHVGQIPSIQQLRFAQGSGSIVMFSKRLCYPKVLWPWSSNCSQFQCRAVNNGPYTSSGTNSSMPLCVYQSVSKLVYCEFWDISDPSSNPDPVISNHVTLGKHLIILGLSFSVY